MCEFKARPTCAHRTAIINISGPDYEALADFCESQNSEFKRDRGLRTSRRVRAERRKIGERRKVAPRPSQAACSDSGPPNAGTIHG